MRCLQQPRRHAGAAPDREAAAGCLTALRPRLPPTGQLGRRVQPPGGGRIAALRRGDERQLHLPPLRHRHTSPRPHPLARDNTRPGLHGAQLLAIQMGGGAMRLQRQERQAVTTNTQEHQGAKHQNRPDNRPLFPPKGLKGLTWDMGQALVPTLKINKLQASSLALVYGRGIVYTIILQH